jgi:hypothetical protein
MIFAEGAIMPKFVNEAILREQTPLNGSPSSQAAAFAGRLKDQKVLIWSYSPSGMFGSTRSASCFSDSCQPR